MGAFTFTVTVHCRDDAHAERLRGAVCQRLAAQLGDGLDCFNAGPVDAGAPAVVVYRYSDAVDTPVRHNLGGDVPVVVFDNGAEDLSEPGLAAEWLACLTADAEALPRRLAAGLLEAAHGELALRHDDLERLTADAERIRAEESAEVLQAGGR